MLAKRISPRFKFGYYDVDDLEQEAFILALDGFKRWDGVRPLENFLSVHIHNRLINFRRNRYHRSHVDDSSPQRKRDNDSKRSLMSPGEIHDLDVVYEVDYVHSLTTEETLEIINHLPAHIKNDFHRLANGASISISRKNTVYEAVRNAVGEYYEEEE
jgi:DNA-directed RNA polymerase specialized sigma24 family protein